MSESQEPIIGVPALDRSGLPDITPPPSTFQRSEIGVHKTIGGEDVIDASGNNAVHSSEKPKTMMEVLHDLEAVVSPERRQILEKTAADYLKDHENQRGLVSLLRSIPDYTEREYLAAIIARYKALDEASQKGGAIENKVGISHFGKLKRLAFGPQPA